MFSSLTSPCYYRKYLCPVTKDPIDILWVILCASLVFLMQAGFLCLEAGSTRSKHNINVVIKNIADLGLSVLCFWGFGYGLMFGNSYYGWIGSSHWAPDVGQGQVWMGVFFLFQAMFCSTAVTIVSGAVAERMRFSSYVLIAILISGIVYPVFGHWAWGGLEGNGTTGWLGHLGFIDFAGSTVVHSTGGWVALASVLILGPRIGRFSSKRGNRQLFGYDLPLASLGTLLLWLGWFGFNGGSVLALDDTVPGILANTLLAAAAGLVTPILLGLCQGQRIAVTAVMNGSLAGLVAITANCHAVNAFDAILIGSLGSGLMLATEHLLQQWHIDDVVGAIPVHLSAGIWGTLAVALFGDLTLLNTGLNRLEQLQVQCLGILIAALWAFGLTYPLLTALNRWYPLRVGRRQEHIGLNVVEHGATSDLVDLIAVMRRQERSGDLSLRSPAEPFTPVGQIAARYNRVMAALEQAVAHTEAIVQSAIEAILTVSPHSLTVQTANPSVRKLFGIAEAQLCGQPLTLLLSLEETAPDCQETMARFLAAASADGTPYEVVGRRRSGSSFPVEVTVATMQTRHETLYTVILRDITLRKQAEEAMQEAAEKDRKTRQLEQALQDLQTAQIQLVQSEKMSSLGQLVSGLAHEINNPVNYIYGNLIHAEHYVDDLLKLLQSYQHSISPVPPALKHLEQDIELEYLLEDLPKLLKSVRGGTERIRDIVQSLRTFSRQGGTELKLVDIRDSIESTLTILGSRLKAHGERPAILVRRHYEPLPAIECYVSQLNQVFMNLLSNAIDALEEKWQAQQSPRWIPTIAIATALPDANRVEITISDNGIGISEETQQRILDPFFTTKPVGKGTGLGMSITYQIVVNQHRGRLRCRSKPSRGSQFIVEIPLWQKNPPSHDLAAPQNGHSPSHQLSHGEHTHRP